MRSRRPAAGQRAANGRRAVKATAALVALLGALTLYPSAAFAVPKSFVGPGSDWNTASNWSPIGVPGAADDVTIATVNATLSTGANATVNSVAVTAPGSLTVAGTNTLDAGSGSSSIAGTVRLDAGGVLRLGGSSTWSAGQLEFGFPTGGGTLEIAGGLSITGDLFAGDFGAGAELIHVLPGGTLNRASGSGATTLNPAVENDGTITTGAGSGLLTLGGGDGAGTSSGSYSPSGTGIVSFAGGSSELTSAASAGGSGTVRVGGGTVQVAAGASWANTSGTTELTGGVFTFDATGTTGTFNSDGAPAGAIRNGTGTLTAQSGGNISGARFAGGTTTVNGTSTITGTVGLDSTGVLRLGGSSTWSAGQLEFGFPTGGGTLEIAGGLSITGDLFAGDFGAGAELIHVLPGGTLNRASGSGATTLNPAVENDGTITTGAGSGLLTLGGGDGAGTSSGSYSPSGTGIVSFAGGSSELTSAASAGGSGTVRVGGGTVQVAAGASWANTSGTTELTGGVFTFDATGTTGTFNSDGAPAGAIRNGTGTLTAQSGGNISGARFAGGTTTVNGTSTITGTVGLDSTGVLRLGGSSTWSAGQLEFGFPTGGGTLEIAGRPVDHR